MVPLAGSTAMPSWTKRPIALSGTGFAAPVAGTSNIQPCVFANVYGLPAVSFSPGSWSVSSHVSQVPQGVGPPAQLRLVPEIALQDLRSLPAFVSNTRFVQPPVPC